MDKLSPQDFPLNEALQEVLQQGATRARQMKDAQHDLHTLQASLLDLDRCRASVCSQVRLKEKTLAALHCEMETLRSSSAALDCQIQRVLLENLQLRSTVEEQRRRSRSQLEELGTHRGRAEAFRSAVRQWESRADVGEELRRRQEEVTGLHGALEELKTHLHNTGVSAIRQTQKEIDLLKANIHGAGQTLRERRGRLQEEEHTHTQLRRDIEIQRRRCEAVRKRLRCQLQKSQSSHQQLRRDVTRLQERLEELRTHTQ